LKTRLKKTRQNKKMERGHDSIQSERALERFRAKWIPVRVKKTRQNKKTERGRDSIQSERALESDEARLPLLAIRQLYSSAVVPRRKSASI
jgi:hypothetical protein